MALGLLLLAAFFAVLQRCRDEFSTGESLAALQDNARQALTVIVRDIEHAGFFGFATGPGVRYTRAGTVLAEGSQLRQPDAAHAIPAVPGLPAGTHDCGVNFALDLEPVSSERKQWLKFLNRDTAFFLGAEEIARTTRYAAFFVKLRRVARGRYQAEFVPRAAAGEQLAAGEFTARYAQLVEDQIRAAPADWPWSHKRWKLKKPLYGA